MGHDAVFLRSTYKEGKYRMRSSLKIVSFLFAFLLLIPTLSLAGQFKVTRVVDGDTIVIDYKGKAEKVRLLCINTPESVHPDEKQNIPMGRVASDYTKKRLQGKYVQLKLEGPLRGKYGRLLAYVFIDGINFNLELVREGLSPYYTKYGLSQSYDEEFQEAERYARKQGLKIWADPELTQKYLRLKSKWGQYRSQQTSSTPTVQAGEAKYVASKKSKVFHVPNCRYSRRISPSNLITFSTRDEAIKSGRRPCKVCNP
jgi:micrococcal nuclease